MRKPPKARANAAPGTVRVAIYCRQSVADEREFGSIEAQREAIEAYVTSQRGEGWVALPEHYDDPGFSGATTERPAFQRLLADVAAGKLDVVATYKIDRISRSLFDFTSFTELLDRRGVGFTAITQNFDTRTSMGRLTLNILASFAEFEREVIAERTHDKMMANRRRGMWTGGRPPLGYDVRERKLVVNADEAEIVRSIFKLYGEHGSLLATANELRRRGIRMKAMTRRGHVTPGDDFTKNSLRALLTSPIYLGRQRAGDAIVDGVHDAIVDQATWDAAQAQLRENRRDGGAETRNKWGALLKGVIFCGRCRSPMRHSFTRKGARVFRYYACARLLEQGAAACQGSRAPAGQLEAFVIDKIRGVGRDDELVAATANAARKDAESRGPGLAGEVRRLGHDAQRLREERENLLRAVAQGGPATGVLMTRLAETEAELNWVESRAVQVRAELAGIESNAVDEADLRAALAAFAPVWAELFPREQARVLRLLVDRVVYDAASGEVEIRLRPGGVQALAADDGRQSA